MSVAGSAIDPDLVPRYLHGLAAERALEGVRFDEFAIERPMPRSAQEPSSGDSPPGGAFNFRAESTSLRTSGGDARS